MQENNNKERRPRSKIGAGLVIGTGVGIAIGAGTDNIAVGIAVGVAIGIALGAAWDRQTKHMEDSRDDN
jgi:hypothetical protein